LLAFLIVTVISNSECYQPITSASSTSLLFSFNDFAPFTKPKKEVIEVGLYAMLRIKRHEVIKP